MIRFSKYEFSKKLLGGLILLRITLGLNLTKLEAKPI